MKSVWWGSPPFKIPAGGEAYKNLNGKYLLGINTEQIPSSNCGLFLESYLNVLCGMGAQAFTRPGVNMLHKSNGVLYFLPQQNS